MPKAIYKCKICSSEKIVDFKVGTLPIVPICPKCNKEMIRTFKKTEVLAATNHSMIDLGQKMLFN